VWAVTFGTAIDKGTGRDGSPPRPLLAVSNVGVKGEGVTGDEAYGTPVVAAAARSINFRVGLFFTGMIFTGKNHV